MSLHCAIFTNDMEENIKSLLTKFEDDTKIGIVVHNEDGSLLESNMACLVS